MALDIHVMPLWRYYAGRFSSPAEKASQKLGIQNVRVGAPKAKMSLPDAYEFDRQLYSTYANSLGNQAPWSLQVSGAFSERLGFDALQAVRAYAAYLDYTPTSGLLRKSAQPFVPSGDLADYPPLVKIYRGKTTSFPHLIHHDDATGWYIPISFPQPLVVNNDFRIVY